MEEEAEGVAIAAAPTFWVRGHARIEGDWIVLDPKQQTKYLPLAGSNMVLEFAAIKKPSDACEFASKYGLLWHGPDADQFVEE